MIRLENVSFKYKKEEVLKNVNLEIREGEFVSIIGQNGSGKSTLAKIISGLERPNKGTVLIDEINTKDRNIEKELRKNVGIVFQNPENQILFNNVHDDIAFAIDNLKLEDKELRIKNSLQKVNMEKYIDNSTYELSLGQKQRITIASVLAINTKYIILDESTTMLDSEGKEAIYDILEKLKSQGYTIIYITNLTEEILMADRIIILNNGEIVEDFNKSSILEKVDLLRKNNIKVPKTVQILCELRKNNININLKKWTQDELIEKIIGVCKK